MGKRKREMAAAIKESRKSVFVAKGSYPSSPRKMRLVVDLIRGKSVEEALYILKFSKQEASDKLEKLVLSAINNFEQKTGERPEEYGLFIKEIMCGGGRMLKRFRPAPQGRAHRIRKRSNHVTVVLGTTKELPGQQVEAVVEETEAAETE